MEAKSFARIVEQQVRKALKTEREEGESQRKTERSIRYTRVSASQYHTELVCFKLLGGITDDTHKEKSFINPLRSSTIETNHCIADDQT